MIAIEWKSIHRSRNCVLWKCFDCDSFCIKNQNRELIL